MLVGMHVRQCSAVGCPLGYRKRSTPPIITVLLLLGSTDTIRLYHAWPLVKSVDVEPWLHQVGLVRAVQVAPKLVETWMLPTTLLCSNKAYKVPGELGAVVNSIRSQ